MHSARFTLKKIAIFAIFLTPFFALAAPLYTPGQTLNPSCGPTDTDCTVSAPALSGSNSDITGLSALTSLTLGSSTITDFLGAGLTISGGALTVNATGAFSTTSTDYWLTQQNSFANLASIGSSTGTTTFLGDAIFNRQIGVQMTPSAYTSLGIAHSGIEDESSGIEIIRNVQQTANNSSFHFGLDSGVHWNLNGFNQTGDIRASYGGLAISGSSGTATKVSDFYAYTTVSGAANITNLYGTFASLGNSGTGVVDTITGSLVQNNASGIGAVNNFVGYQVQDSAASTTVKGFVGNITSGTGKYNVYMPGTAQNYFAGNVGIGTTTPSTKFQAYLSATRYVSLLDTNTTISNMFRVDDNSAANIFTLENRDITATTDQGLDIDYRFADNSSTAALNAGTIRLAKEQQWTSTASTRDSYFAFSPATDGNTTERLRIVGSTGNVGMGTTTPRAKLDVAGTNNATVPLFQLSSVSAFATTTQLIVTNSGFVGIGTSSPARALQLEGAGGSQIRIQRNDSAGANAVIEFTGNDGVVDGSISYNNRVGASITFETGGSTNTRMMIDATGNVGIGTTSASALSRLDVAGANNATVPLLQLSSVSAFATTTRFIVTNSGNTGIGTGTPAARLGLTQSANDSTGGLWIAETGNTDFRSIYMATDGTMSFYGGDTVGALNTATLNAAGAWTNASDRSYKENIIDLGNKYGLSTVLASQPRFYEMKGTHLPQVGFIAQELKLLVPEVVDGQEGKMGISYGNLVAVAFQAIKDLNAKVEEMVKSLFVKELHIEEKLCVDDICINKDELKALLLKSQSATTTYATDFGAPIPQVTLPLAPSATSTMVLDGPVVIATTTATTTETVASTTPIVIEQPVATTTATTTNETQP